MLRMEALRTKLATALACKESDTDANVTGLEKSTVTKNENGSILIKWHYSAEITLVKVNVRARLAALAVTLHDYKLEEGNSAESYNFKVVGWNSDSTAQMMVNYAFLEEVLLTPRPVEDQTPDKDLYWIADKAYIPFAPPAEPTWEGQT